tara:strand:+ start:253 stop:501 length:249 start_codon:yes stop_codon:yes gene_type:complete
VNKMSKYEEQVIKKIRERAEVGKNKYGVTMERTDLNTLEWLVHLQEELMDAAVYIERLMRDFERLKLATKYGEEFADLMEEL